MMIKRIRRNVFIMTVLLVLCWSGTSGGTILDTKHNLSVSGPGTVKATTEERVCIFCHTPHKGSRVIAYLWDHQVSTAGYIPYESSTLYAAVGQPTGTSKLCLSCHDGTIALGALLSEPQEITFAGGIRFMPVGPTRIDTDLSDDHPVSFLYDTNLAASNGELVDPSTLPAEVMLDTNQELQCTSCHDPHENPYGKFLVMLNQYGDLCTACHQKTGWPAGSHATSNAGWNGLGTDPWPHTDYTTVSGNACENCHKPHTAGGHERLLNYAPEEDNCLACHNGNVASTDIESALPKPYVHPVGDYTGIHDPAEDFTSGAVQKHVECQDCHNPHMVNSAPSPGAPQVSGWNIGVKGIDASGTQIANSQNLYEICFKCHGDNNVISVLPITRQIEQLNARMEFDPANPSFHPVESAGVNPNVPSLLPPYTTLSIIFCTDCHNNDDPAGPKGPHGSINRYLLEKNYTTADYTTETSYNYALCYKCHDRNSILNNESFREGGGMGGGGGGGGMNRGGHSGHVVTARAPCATCHDPHGISNTQGNQLNNHHLINFNLEIVSPNSYGDLYFEDLGTFTGRCYLSCHGKSHNPKTYP